MAGQPHYQITSCCDQDTNTGTFLIPSTGAVINGVYVYNGISFQETTTGMWFYTGYCYTVQYLGTNFTIYPTAFSESDIVFVSDTECSSPECVGCEFVLPTAYSVFACCDTANIVNLNLDFSGCGGYSNYIYNYNGSGFVTASGFVFESGQCYNIQVIENGAYDVGPSCEDLTAGEYRFCNDAITDGFCPACALGLQYLSFTNCCTDETLLFKGIDASLYYGVQEYIGAPVNGLVNKCYGIEIGTVGDATVPDIAAYNALPSPPLYNEGINFVSISSVSTKCENFIPQCPSCVIPCYTLYNCDGNNFNTTSDLLAYVGTFVTISNADGPVAGTWLVFENTGDCTDAVNDITVVNANPEPCPIKCYQITGNPTTVTYINSDKELIVQLGGGKVCSYITPIVTGPTTGFVVELGDCVDGECPEICFEFTNCQTGEILVVSNAPSIIPYYAQEQIVTLQGYDGCWSIDISEVCTCPVSVTVLKAYASCPACLPIVNYKFTNCDNQSIIKYSIEDYSAYVGKTVKLECGQCWFVSEIDYVPPSTQPISITFTFDSCTACAKDYYKLTNCIDPSHVIYTSTPISTPPLDYTSCDCVSVTYTTLNGVTATVQVTTTTEGPYGKPLYEFNGYYLYWITDGGGAWILASGTGGTDTIYSYLESTSTCPFGNYSQSKDSPDIVYLLVEPCATSSTVTIKECEGCWTAKKTNSPVNPTDVTLIDQFIDCAECYRAAPCICSTITNQDIVEHTYSYLDCEFKQSTVTLQAGETSNRLCVVKWLSADTSCDCITMLVGNVNIDQNVVGDFWLVFYPTGDNFNGKPLWISNYLIGTETNTLYIYWNITSSSWITSSTYGSDGFGELNADITCPIGSWTINGSEPYTLDTIKCSPPCECIVVTVTDSIGDSYNLQLLITSEIRNGHPVYNNTVTPDNVYTELYFDGDDKWVIEINNIGIGYTLLLDQCPISSNWVNNMLSGFTITGSTYCTTNTNSNSSLDTAYIEYFGDCTNGECPPIVYPKRKVKPGYSTPTCDIEKYEKITCRSSEILYKQVMRLRYGISNCCPEDDEKWLIKKELIELEALRDPDYICRPVTSCCGQTINDCGCGCNSTLKTCNSQ